MDSRQTQHQLTLFYNDSFSARINNTPGTNRGRRTNLPSQINCIAQLAISIWRIIPHKIVSIGKSCIMEQGVSHNNVGLAAHRQSIREYVVGAAGIALLEARIFCQRQHAVNDTASISCVTQLNLPNEGRGGVEQLDGLCCVAL